VIEPVSRPYGEQEEPSCYRVHHVKFPAFCDSPDRDNDQRR